MRALIGWYEIVELLAREQSSFVPRAGKFCSYGIRASLAYTFSTILIIRPAVTINARR